jgi:hypothetical protein
MFAVGYALARRGRAARLRDLDGRLWRRPFLRLRRRFSHAANPSSVLTGFIEHGFYAAIPCRSAQQCFPYFT